MQSMKKRLSGEGVAPKIRYADVAKRKPAKQVCTPHSVNSTESWAISSVRAYRLLDKVFTRLVAHIIN